MNILVAILIFCAIILFHEFGHFIVAKACGVKVNEFCLGFGPTLIGHQWGETYYSIKLLPFGGACIMEGEEESSDDDRSFNHRPVWQRMLIVLAGPFFNFIMAFVLSIILIANIGINYPVVAEVSEGGGAEEAGLQSGDEIVSLGDHAIHFFSEIRIYLYFHHDPDMELTYERDGQEYETQITPQYNETYGSYLLGITGGAYQQAGSAWEVLKYSVYEVEYQVYSCVQSLAYLLSGQAKLTDVSGAVGIVKTIGDTYEEASQDGAFYVAMNMINITILLSANLGVMNLLPIPALDGGRFLLYVIEAIRRKKLDEKIEMGINMVGLIILLALMGLVMVSDIMKLF